MKLKKPSRELIYLLVAAGFVFLLGFVLALTAVRPAVNLSGKQVVEFKDGSSLWFYSRQRMNVAILHQHFGDLDINAKVSTPTEVIYILSRSRSAPPEPVYFPKGNP